MDASAAITLADDALRVTCTPDQGFSIRSFVDVASGADALWQRPGHTPTPCSRALGPAGTASEQSFLDVFGGGWFEMFPEVGYTLEGDDTSFLHGEVVRLPWTVTDHGPAHVEARVATLRRPLALTRRMELRDGVLHVSERIENVGMAPAPYTWGQHPCFSRATFAGGRLEIPVARAEVPDPWFDPEHATLAHGPFDWPHAPARSAGAVVDLGAIPPTADRRQDHACLTMAGGGFRLTAPSAGADGRALRVAFDHAQFPYVLLWECFGAGEGAPTWGGWDTFGVEFSTIPGRTTPDAIAAGAVRTLAPGETAATEWTIGWESL